MKKGVAIFLAFFYLLTSVGVAVNMHYCGDELKSLALIVSADSCCGDDNTCDCCKDETLVFQNDSDGVSPRIVQVNSHYDDQIHPEFIFSFNYDISGRESSPILFFSTSPPLGVPIYLLNCTLTYYG